MTDEELTKHKLTKGSDEGSDMGDSSDGVWLHHAQNSTFTGFHIYDSKAERPVARAWAYAIVALASASAFFIIAIGLRIYNGW